MLPTNLPYKRNVSRLLALMGLAMIALTGCARSVVSTEVNADGTWKRTVKLYASAPAKDAMFSGGTLDDTFVLPKGPGITATRALDKSDKMHGDKKAGQEQPAMPAMPGADMEVYTATRTCALGETVTHDVAIKGGQGKEKAVEVANLVTVQRIAPNRLEYREVVRWVGKTPGAFKSADMGMSDKELMAELKRDLPPELVTPESTKTLLNQMMPELSHLLFGPNDPLIADIFSMMFFPDAAKFKLQKRFGSMFDHILAVTYGDKLPVERRHAVVRKLIDNQTDFLQDNVQKKTAGGPAGMAAAGGKGDSGDFVSMTYSLHLPGRIVETNGDADPISGDVNWIFYSPAVQAGEVEMRAVCETQ
jgi:hypothetical protein